MTLHDEDIAIAATISSLIITSYMSGVITEAERQERKALKRYGKSDGIPKYCLKEVLSDIRYLMRGMYDVVS